MQIAHVNFTYPWGETPVGGAIDRCISHPISHLLYDFWISAWLWIGLIRRSIFSSVVKFPWMHAVRCAIMLVYVYNYNPCKFLLHIYTTPTILIIMLRHLCVHAWRLPGFFISSSYIAGL